MARYSDIRRGGELKQALTNYINYLQNMDDRPTKRQKGGAVERTPFKKVNIQILPFGLTLATTIPGLIIRGSSKSIGSGGALQSILGNVRANPTVADTADVLSTKEFRPAKVHAFRVTGAGTYKQSKVTKLYYIDYPGDTYSAPFGALNATEEYATAVRLIRADIIKAFAGARSARISFRPEFIN